jgi:hypothetical protein
MKMSILSKSLVFAPLLAILLVTPPAMAQPPAADAARG